MIWLHVIRPMSTVQSIGLSMRAEPAGLVEKFAVADIVLGPVSWERMIAAVEKVRDRLRRATAALEEAGILYAIVGGNAIAAWVSRVDESAVRNTPDVDILLRRSDFERAKEALGHCGFIYRHTESGGLFLDGPPAKARDAVKLIFADEKTQHDNLEPTPDVKESEAPGGFRILRLEALVRMKLVSFRIKDKMHLRDLIDVGLVDQSWLTRLSPELATRLQGLLDHPDG